MLYSFFRQETFIGNNKLFSILHNDLSCVLNNLKCFIKNTFLLFVTFFLICNPTSTNAQTNNLKFKHLTIEQGLSQSYAFSIVQDKAGFVWIATTDGLNRYDGKNFVNYRHKINDNKSVADNFIRKLFIDSENTLWVGTKNGLSRYNEELDNFDNFYHVENDSNSLHDNIIWDIYESTSTETNEKSLWVSTAIGIQKFVPEDNNFSRLRVRGFEDSFKEIKTIFQDEQGNFWFGTYEKGIYLLNEKLTYAVSLKNNKANSKWDININADSMFEAVLIDDKYWLATSEGLYIVSRDYVIEKHITQENSAQGLISNEVRAIVKLNNNQVWLGTKKGVNVVDILNYNIEKITDQNSNLTFNYILDMLLNDSGEIWIGTFGGGVNKYSLFNSSFSHGHSQKSNDSGWIDSIAQSSDGRIWFATESSWLYNLEEKTSKKSIQLPIDGSVRHIISDDYNNLWARTSNNELFKISLDNNEITLQENWEKESLHATGVQLSIIGENILFRDSESNLKIYNTKFDSFKSLSLKNNSLINGVAVDSNDTILIHTNKNELYTFSLESLLFTKLGTYKSSDFFPNKKMYASKRWIWLGSLDQGIKLINRKTLQAYTLNEDNNLLNNYVADIVIDEEENAWVSTHKGISTINPQTKIIRNFTRSFGLSNSEFVSLSSLKSTDNVIFFGSQNGYYQFDPILILKIEQKISPPVLLNAYIANKKLATNVRNYDDKKENFNLNSRENLTIKHNQFPLSIEFSSPNPKLPEQLNYKYRLLGLEDEWIESNNNIFQATYTNLDPNDYVFEVQAYDKYQNSISETKRLPIKILPPWWLTRSAILIYVLSAFLFCLYILQQVRHKRQYHFQIKKSEERLKLSLWGSGDEMWDWNIVTGKIFRSNIWGILEFPQDGTRNVGAEQTNIHPHDIPRVREALSQHFDKKTEHFESTYRVKDQQDQWVWILDRGKIVERNDKGEAVRMTGTLKDISQIKKAEERLKLFAKCIENISDAVVIYDRQFTIVDVNKAFYRITGKSKTEMVGCPFKFEGYPESFTQGVKKHLITQGSWHGEVESRRSNGESYFSDLNIDVIRDENGNISHFVGAFSDITTRKQSEVELRKLANSDTLTGLPNRSYFQANQSRLVRNKIPHALLVFDLDNFKKVNDSMGHQVGDILLCEVAKRLVHVGANNETVYRLGGDEFSIIIENTNDIHTITSLAKNILSTIAQPMKLKNQEVVLYSSIGIVLYPEDGSTPQELLKNADTAMYHAKDIGGNRYQFFSDSMNKQAVKRLQIETLIRHGLKDDYFSVFYQPKIEISTGKIAGMEALVRFETPTKGIISPVVFIPVSEETGQIIDIGEIVLRKACFATKRWVDAGLFDGRIAVNLSAVQFTQPNLVKVITSILNESQLPAKYLELEITEGTVMDSPQKAIETMLQIRSLGIHLALDDFGTGYSSLAYLKKFPLNTLKIDKAFVDDIETSEQGRNMVATIVTIAHNLGMQVVAEGVETNSQLNFLAGLKCEQLQGYLYSKPIAEKEFQKYLLSHQITDKSTSSITKS